MRQEVRLELPMAAPAPPRPIEAGASGRDGFGLAPAALTATAYIGIGANLGAAEATVRSALAALAALPGCALRRASSLYRSAPVDATGPDFINAVVELDTACSPEALLAALQGVEQAFGRQRPYPNAPRTLDLDLLLYGDTVLHTPALTLPHPRLHLRAFVLQPLLELAPDLVVPGLGPLAAHRAGTAGQRVERLAGPRMLPPTIAG